MGLSPEASGYFPILSPVMGFLALGDIPGEALAHVVTKAEEVIRQSLAHEPDQ